MGKHHHDRDSYTLDVDLGGHPDLPRLGYDPQPPLDLDARPIDGEDLRAWRHRQNADTPSGRLTLPETTRQLTGEEGTLWANWETGECSPCWAALVREWAREDREPTFPQKRAAPEKVRAVAQAVGGYAVLAECLGYNAHSVAQWGRSRRESEQHRVGAGPQGGAGPLVNWLFEEFALEPVEEVHRGQVSPRLELTPAQVREIRRRADDGEPLTEITDDLEGVSYTVVCDAANRDTYEWVK